MCFGLSAHLHLLLPPFYFINFSFQIWLLAPSNSSPCHIIFMHVLCLTPCHNWFTYNMNYFRSWVTHTCIVHTSLWLQVLMFSTDWDHNDDEHSQRAHWIICFTNPPCMYTSQWSETSKSETTERKYVLILISWKKWLIGALVL